MVSAGFLAIAACQPLVEEPDVVMEKAWVRPVPPGMSVTAAYGEFSNNTRKPVELLKFESSEFGDVSLHRTVIEDGISRMRPVDRLIIEPGEVQVLEPGGLHLMLMAPVQTVAVVEAVRLTAISVDGERYTFELPVAASVGN